MAFAQKIRFVASATGRLLNAVGEVGAYFLAPGLAELFFCIDSIFPLPVALPWRAALVVELEREARLGPVAGAVLTFLLPRWPLLGA